MEEFFAENLNFFCQPGQKSQGKQEQAEQMGGDICQIISKCKDPVAEGEEIEHRADEHGEQDIQPHLSAGGRHGIEKQCHRDRRPE